MTTTVRHRIRLHRPADLLAALPHLLGFHPENSLIAIMISREQPARIDGAFRLDLPDADLADAVRDQLAGVLRDRRPSAVVLAVIGGPVPPDGPPARPALVAALTETLTGQGLSVPHALWAPRLAAGEPWHCYQHPDCGGELPDPGESELAAVNVVDGFVTFASREELVALLTPDDPAALSRREERLGAAQDAADADRSMHDDTVQRDFRLVLDAVHRIGQHRPHLTDDDLVGLTVALGDHRVRDLCMGIALTPLAAAAEQLWLTLTKSTPVPERVEPATLLAYAAIVRGDGALGGIALDRALEAHPTHTLARLLRQALDSGIPPEKLRGLAVDAAAELGYDLGELDTP